MNFLNKLTGSSISSRLLSISLRNLSISSNSQTTTDNSFFAGSLENHEFNLKPLKAKPNNNVIKDVGINCPLWRRKEIFELPLTNKIVENPTQINKVIEDITNIDKTVSLPDNNKSDETGKQAKNGMIMIRRRKMRKHKLRKLRKKMKYEWAKVRQRRQKRKEKAFQAELTAQIREAENFSAEAYVAEKLRLATENPIPRFWKHKRLPEFFIKQKLEQQEKRARYKKLEMWEKYGSQ